MSGTQSWRWSQGVQRSGKPYINSKERDFYQILDRLDPQKKLAHAVLVFSSTGCSQLFNAARCLFAQSFFGSAGRRTLEPKDAQPQKHPQNLWFWEEHGLVGGLNPTPLKNDGVKVSWDYELPNIWKNKKIMFQTTNQRGVAPFTSAKRLWLGLLGHPCAAKSFQALLLISQHLGHWTTLGGWLNSPSDGQGCLRFIRCVKVYSPTTRIDILLWLITHLPSGKLT